MRRRASSLPLAALLLALAAAPAAAHMSKGVDPSKETGGTFAGLQCDLLHTLNPPADTDTYFRIEVPGELKPIAAATEAKYRTFAVTEDTEFTLKTNGKAFCDAVKDKLEKGLKGQNPDFDEALKAFRAMTGRAGIDVSNPEVDVQVVTVRWQLVEFEVDDNLKVSDKGVFQDVGSAVEKKFRFATPIDPLASLGIRATLVYKWTIKVQGHEFGNEADEENDLIALTVTDVTPPESIGFSPNALFGTTGDTIAKFNEHRERRGVTLVPKNPDHLLMLVGDNARYAYAGGTGIFHDRKHINARLYVETYVSQVTGEKPARPTTPVENAFNEFYTGNETPPAYPAGMGRFVWVGPIDLRKDLGLVPQTTPNAVSGSDSSAPCNVHVWRIPIAELERKCLELLKSQYGGLIDFDRETFLDRHFAGATFFEFRDEAWGPPHFIDNLRYFDLDGTSAELGGYEHLRITAAVSDAAGNWIVPTEAPSFLDRDPVAEFPADYEKRFVASHAGQIPIVVFDNDKPNPMLIVTAQGRNGEARTTRFTIPNSDLALKEKADEGVTGEIGPWINDDREWVFDWKGESPTMQWLATHDRKRHDEFKAALEILENTRVVVEIAAWDNVNKIVRKEDGSDYCKFGIWTPQVSPKGVGDLQFERPVTWTIRDPTVPDEEMLYEDPASKMFVYPDYIFRKVDPAKMSPSADGSSGYGFEVMVNDRSNFNDPAKNGGSLTNWRKITLWFNVIPSAGTGVDRLGNQETVDQGGKGKE